MTKHLALVNDHRWIDPPERNAYIRNILEEDRILSTALGSRGFTVSRVDWADGNIDWRRFDVIVIRQTWDYFERLDEFRAWLDRVETQTLVINPVEVIRWNCDKRYLIDLHAAGVPTVPTVVIDRQDPVPELAALLDRSGFSEAVIKPAVSGAGRETYRVARDGVAALEPTWRRLVAAEAMLVQPFMPAIIEYGELSLMAIDGEVTHGVRKIAAAGEFRVQDDHGGTVHEHDPTPTEIGVTQQAIAAVPGEVAYARIDLVDSETGPCVMELELIEPELFFRQNVNAAARLATAVDSAIRATS